MGTTDSAQPALRRCAGVTNPATNKPRRCCITCTLRSVDPMGGALLIRPLVRFDRRASEWVCSDRKEYGATLLTQTGGRA